MIDLHAGNIEGIITIFKGADPCNLDELPSFKNLITDNGLRLFGSSDNFLRYCNIGSGSTVPSASDTSLTNRLRGSNTINGIDVSGADNTDALNPFVYKRRRIRFAPTGSAYNVSEIAFGEDAAGLNLFNRVLVKDVGGSPISLSVLGDEFLDVQIEVRVYPPMTDMAGTLTPTGKDTTPRTWTARASGAGGTLSNRSYDAWTADGDLIGLRSGVAQTLAFTGSLPTIFSTPTGSLGAAQANTATMTATGASYIRTISAGLTNWVGLIKTIRLQSDGNNMNIEFDPPFDKKNTDTFEIKFKMSWGRR